MSYECIASGNLSLLFFGLSATPYVTPLLYQHRITFLPTIYLGSYKCA
jgi:hypothetical protein